MGNGQKTVNSKQWAVYSGQWLKESGQWEIRITSGQLILKKIGNIRFLY